MTTKQNNWEERVKQTHMFTRSYLKKWSFPLEKIDAVIDDYDYVINLAYQQGLKEGLGQGLGLIQKEAKKNLHKQLQNNNSPKKQKFYDTCSIVYQTLSNIFKHEINYIETLLRQRKAKMKRKRKSNS